MPACSREERADCCRAALSLFFRSFDREAGRKVLATEIDRLLVGESAGRADTKATLVKRIERIERDTSLTPAQRRVALQVVLRTGLERGE